MARNITSDQENEDRRERERERVHVYLRNVIENLRDFTVAQHNSTCGTCSHKQDDFGQRHLRYNNRSSLSTMMMLPKTTVTWLLLDPLPSAAAGKKIPSPAPLPYGVPRSRPLPLPCVPTLRTRARTRGTRERNKR